MWLLGRGLKALCQVFLLLSLAVPWESEATVPAPPYWRVRDRLPWEVDSARGHSACPGVLFKHFAGGTTGFPLYRGDTETQTGEAIGAHSGWGWSWGSDLG